MQRIGLAASKMAKGRLALYNLFVVLIASFFSLFVFFIAGFSILAVLFLIFIISRGFMPSAVNASFIGITRLSLIALVVVVGIFNLLAIIKNIKLNRHKI